MAGTGRLHLGASAVGEPGADLGSHVAIIGGGDNAFDVSRMLAEKGVRVSVIMRSKSPKAQPLLVERLRRHQASGLVQLMAERTVEALDDAGSRLGIRLRGGGEIDADHVVLLFGYRPNTNDPSLAELAPATDARGDLLVDCNMETSCRRAFAARDACCSAVLRRVTAPQSGATVV